ncbi:MAG: DUF4382 domain-containing protein [Cyclobacteriaceae bacterium]
MKKLSVLFIPIILVFVLFTSCNEDTPEAGLATGTAELSMYATSSGDIQLNTGRINEALTIDEAFIGISKVELKSDIESDEEELAEDEGEEEDEEIEYNWEGPFVINLLTGESNPEYDPTEVEVGVYTKFEAEFDQVVGDTASLVIRGSIMTDNGEVPFEYEYNQSEDLKVESESGFEVNEDSFNNLLVEFDISSLFEGVDFSQADSGDDGVIRINKDMNRDLADIIETNFELATSFGEDIDGDDSLDDDED